MLEEKLEGSTVGTIEGNTEEKALAKATEKRAARVALADQHTSNISDYGTVAVGGKLADMYDYTIKHRKNVNNGTSIRPTFLTAPNALSTIQKNYVEAQVNEAREMAANQGWPEQASAFMARSVFGEILMGGVQGTGYLLDVQHWGAKLFGGEGDWDNWLSKLATDTKDGITKSNPIYLNPDKQGKGMMTSMGDPGWWWENGISVASTLSIAIPVFGAGRAAGLLGKGIAYASRGARVGKAGGRAAKVISTVDKVLDKVPMMSEINSTIAKGILNGTTSRLIESQMEATAIFNEKYEQYKAIPGMSDAKAKEVAGKAASFAYNANWAMLLTDIPQYMFMGKSGKKLKSALHSKKPGFITNNKILKNTKTLRSIGATMGAEGAEEAYQFMVGEEAKRYGDIIAGVPGAEGSGEFMDRLGEYYDSSEMWTSALFGALGGGVFKAAGPGVSNLVNKAFRKGEKKMTAEDVRINEEKDRYVKLSHNLNQMSKAANTGDQEALFHAKADTAYETARGAVMANNWEKARVSMLRMKNATPEQRAEYGLGENFDEFVENIDTWVAHMDTAAAIVEKAKSKYTYGLADIVAKRTFQKAMHGEQMTDIDARMEREAADVLTDRELMSPDGNSALEAELQIRAQKNANEVLLKAAEDPGISAGRKAELLDQHADGVTVIAEYETRLDQINNESETLTAIDKVVLEEVKSGIADDLVTLGTKKALLTRMNNINTKELKHWTSRAGAREFKVARAKQYKAAAKAKAEAEEAAIIAEESDKAAGVSTGEPSTNAASKEGKLTLKDKADQIKNGTAKVEDFATTEAEIQDLRAQIEEFEELRSTNRNIDKEEKEEDGYDINDEDGPIFGSSTPGEEIVQPDITPDEVNPKESTEDFQGQLEDNLEAAEAYVNIETAIDSPVDADWRVGDDTNSHKVSEQSNQLGWLSSNNRKAGADVKADEANIALSAYLESPLTSLRGVTLEFSVNEEHIMSFRDEQGNLTKYSEIATALEQGKIPEDVGAVPITAKLMKDGVQITHNGVPLQMSMHDSSFFARADGSVKSANGVALAQEVAGHKKAIVANLLKGKKVSAPINSKSSGVLNVKRGPNGEFIRQPIAQTLKRSIAKIALMVGNHNGNYMKANKQIKAGFLKFASAESGAIYADVKTANGAPFPLRLQVRNITSKEASLVYTIYAELMANPNMLSQPISEALVAYLEESDVPAIAGIKEYMGDVSRMTYEELLGELVYEGDKTKASNDGRLYIKPGTTTNGSTGPAVLMFGEQQMNADRLNTPEGKALLEKHLMENKRRHVNMNRLEDVSYKNYINDVGVISTNVEATPEGNIFIQPVVTYGSNLEAHTPTNAATESTQQVKDGLSALGYTKGEVAQMTPDVAQKIVMDQVAPSRVSAVDSQTKTAAVIALKEDLAREKSSEFGSAERVAEIEENISKLEVNPSTTSNPSSTVASIEASRAAELKEVADKVDEEDFVAMVDMHAEQYEINAKYNAEIAALGQQSETAVPKSAEQSGAVEAKQAEIEQAKQKILEDKVQELIEKDKTFREEDGSVLKENEAAWIQNKADIEQAKIDTRRGNLEKGKDAKISIKTRVPGNNYNKTLTGKEEIIAEEKIEAIIQQVISGKMTAEEALQLIVAEYAWTMNASTAIDLYIRDRTTDAPEIGNNKQSFSAWRKGEFDTQQSSEVDKINKEEQEELDAVKAVERKPITKGLERIENLEKQYSTAKTESEKEKIAIKLLNEVARFRKNNAREQATDLEVDRINTIEKSMKESHGLEIVSLLGKKYNTGNRTDVANFESGDTEGEVSIYSREVNPQVNKNGVMVQPGKYDVLLSTTQEEANEILKPKQSKLNKVKAKYQAKRDALEATQQTGGVEAKEAEIEEWENNTPFQISKQKARPDLKQENVFDSFDISTTISEQEFNRIKNTGNPIKLIDSNKNEFIPETYEEYAKYIEYEKKMLSAKIEQAIRAKDEQKGIENLVVNLSKNYGYDMIDVAQIKRFVKARRSGKTNASTAEWLLGPLAKTTALEQPTQQSGGVASTTELQAIVDKRVTRAKTKLAEAVTVAEKAQAITTYKEHKSKAEDNGVEVNKEDSAEFERVEKELNAEGYIIDTVVIGSTVTKGTIIDVDSDRSTVSKEATGVKLEFTKRVVTHVIKPEIVSNDFQVQRAEVVLETVPKTVTELQDDIKVAEAKNVMLEKMGKEADNSAIEAIEKRIAELTVSETQQGDAVAPVADKTNPVKAIGNTIAMFQSGIQTKDGGPVLVVEKEIEEVKQLTEAKVISVDKVIEESVSEAEVKAIAVEESITAEEVPAAIKEEVVKQMAEKTPKKDSDRISLLSKVGSRVKKTLLKVMIVATLFNATSFTSPNTSDTAAYDSVRVENLESFDNVILDQEAINKKDNLDVIIESMKEEGSYIVVDKQHSMAHLYEGDSLVSSYEVGTGKEKGDEQTKTVVKDGKVLWQEGNKQTGAGIYEVGGVGTYKHSPSYTLTNENGISVPTVLHETLSNRKALFNNNNTEDNRMSYGCVNFQAQSLQDLGARGVITEGSKVFILPDNPNNKFQLVDGDLKFVSSNAEVNRSAVGYDVQDLVLKAKGVNSGGKEFLSTLSESKGALMQLYPTVSNDIYNQVAKIAYGIFGQESSFGTFGGVRGHLGYLKDEVAATFTDKDVSVGVTQIRLSSVNQKTRDAFNITTIADLKDDNKKAAAATMSLLLDIYENQIPASLKGDFKELLPLGYSNRTEFAKGVAGNSTVYNNAYVNNVTANGAKVSAYIGIADTSTTPSKPTASNVTTNAAEAVQAVRNNIIRKGNTSPAAKRKSALDQFKKDAKVVSKPKLETLNGNINVILPNKDEFEENPC